MAGEARKNKSLGQYRLPGAKDKTLEIKASTLPYRLQGMGYGMGAAALYCHFVLKSWSEYLLIASVILGYFVGWAVGYIFINKK